MDIGNTATPIIPVKIGDANNTGDAGLLLLNAGVYANTIVDHGVARNIAGL